LTISVWPVDAVNGAPQYSGRKLRQTTNAPFLSGASSSRPLGARSGVRPGTPSSTVTATSTTVTVGAFAGVIDGEAAGEAGPYTFSSDSAVTFTSSTSDVFPAANASNPRLDIVYVQVSDPAEGDGSTVPGVAVRYLAGSPAGSPTAPATPARSFVVAQVNVPKAGGGTPTVSFTSPIAVAAGGVVPVQSITELNALPGTAGMYADLRATTDTVNYPVGLYRSNGSGWSSAIPRIKSVPFSGTTNSNGILLIRHNLGVVPLGAWVQMQNGGTSAAIPLSRGVIWDNPITDPNSLQVRFVNTTNGSWLGGNTFVGFLMVMA
jgi:hypothetical protein